MRTLFAGILAASLLTSQMAAAQQCARPADKAAFDTAGLKSQLMVTAISCSQEEKYNAFIMRFRPNLVSQEKALNTYFSRAFGRRAQKEHDDYITQLANVQSQTGIQQGTAFCAKNLGMFDKVMALNSNELQSFASNASLIQPVTLVECAVPAPRTTRTAQASGTHARHR